MCRHVGYAGPPVALADVLLRPSHSLEKQSYVPRELLSGVVCADGHGVAWYDDSVRREPARYASPMPIWSDTNLASFGTLVQSQLFVGAVRNATVAGSNESSNCAPFVAGRFCWSLNGFLEDFLGSWKKHLEAEWTSEARASAVVGGTDGEWLFAAALSSYDEDPEAGFSQAMQTLLRDVLTRAGELGQEAQLNVLACDGQHLYATRCGTGTPNSLYTLVDGQDFPASVLVASEPLDGDAQWQPVAPGGLVVLQGGAPPVRLQV